MNWYLRPFQTSLKFLFRKTEVAFVNFLFDNSMKIQWNSWPSIKIPQNKGDYSFFPDTVES